MTSAASAPSLPGPEHGVHATVSHAETTKKDGQNVLAPIDEAPLPLASYRRTISMPNSDLLRLSTKSRHRVKTYGEVFTPRVMVDQMLDLVSEDLESDEGFVDKTFLEPAAGDGNFLLAILQRKLAAIEERLAPSLWPRESLFAVASIYAVELLEDNHRAAQGILISEFVKFHAVNGASCSPRTDLYRAAMYIIEKNIVRGNTLTGETPDGEDIEFSWWARQPDDPSMAKREPFTLKALREPGALDFALHTSYEPCLIHHVHKEANADV